MAGKNLGALKPARSALAQDECGEWKPQLPWTVGQVFELGDDPTGDHRRSHGPGNLGKGLMRAAQMHGSWFPPGRGWEWVGGKGMAMRAGKRISRVKLKVNVTLKSVMDEIRCLQKTHRDVGQTFHTSKNGQRKSRSSAVGGEDGRRTLPRQGKGQGNPQEVPLSSASTLVWPLEVWHTPGVPLTPSPDTGVWCPRPGPLPLGCLLQDRLVVRPASSCPSAPPETLRPEHWLSVSSECFTGCLLQRACGRQGLRRAPSVLREDTELA